MKIFQVLNDHTYAQLVPRDPKYDTAALSDFVVGKTPGFPVASLRRSPDSDPASPLASCFLLYGIAVPILCEQAAAAFGDMLRSDGQLFPCESEEGQCYAFRAHAPIDCLDYKGSEIDYAYSMREKRSLVREVKRYAFHVGKVASAAMFLLPEFPLTKVFVTESFASAYGKSLLTGLQLLQLDLAQARNDIVDVFRLKRQQRQQKKKKI